MTLALKSPERCYSAVCQCVGGTGHMTSVTYARGLHARGYRHGIPVQPPVSVDLAQLLTANCQRLANVWAVSTCDCTELLNAFARCVRTTTIRLDHRATTAEKLEDSRVVSVLNSGPGFKSQPRRCRVTVLGKLFTLIVPLFTKQRNW